VGDTEPPHAPPGGTTPVYRHHDAHPHHHDVPHPQDALHAYDDSLTQGILRHLLDRLRLDPAPLGRPGAADDLDAALKGLIGPQGSDPTEVLRRYAQAVEPTVISCDSPRFLAFIPGALSKAAAL